MSCNRIIISRHVNFDEHRFPFANRAPAPRTPMSFLMHLLTLCRPVRLNRHIFFFL
jgi:hypothetical protein